jgi:hypothetical protein
LPVAPLPANEKIALCATNAWFLVRSCEDRRAYGRSKTANVLFAVEFDSRRRTHGIRATGAHPGVIQTELSRYMTNEVRDRLIQSTNTGRPAGAPEFKCRGEHCLVPFFPLGGFSPLQSSDLSEVAARLGATPMQVALAWLLKRAPNTLLIPGTSSRAHLRENLAGAELKLPDDAVTALHRISDRLHVAGRTLP